MPLKDVPIGIDDSSNKEVEKVGKIKKAFLALHKKKTKAVILEIPILFETNAHKTCDYTILVYVNEKEQFKHRRKIYFNTKNIKLNFI